MEAGRNTTAVDGDALAEMEFWWIAAGFEKNGVQ